MLEQILLPLDGSTLAECVLPHAVTIARATMARLTLLHVVEPGPGAESATTDPLHWHLRKAESQAYLEEITKRLRKLDLNVGSVQLEGHAAERIVEYARDEAADLILLSSHGKSGLSPWNVSSLVQKVILRANRSMMIVRAYERGVQDLGEMSYRRILVPMDGSRRAEHVLPIASALAADGELVLTSVVTRPEMPRRSPLSEEDAELAEKVVARNREEAEKYLQQLKSWLSQPVSTRLLVAESAVTALHRLAQEEHVDLVALSAHGYSGDVHRPYGSLVTSFIIYGSTPLLIIQDLPADLIESTKAETVTTRSLVTHRVQGGPTATHAESQE
ncbi:MAG: universal stress protein [Anaerolineae bacterium]|nr:universal stress protein [Anaerolineae bacterium]